MAEGLDNLCIHHLWRSVTLMRFRVSHYHLQDDDRESNRYVEYIKSLSSYFHRKTATAELSAACFLSVSIIFHVQ